MILLYLGNFRFLPFAVDEVFQCIRLPFLLVITEFSVCGTISILTKISALSIKFLSFVYTIKIMCLCDRNGCLFNSINGNHVSIFLHKR